MGCRQGGLTSLDEEKRPVDPVEGRDEVLDQSEVPGFGFKGQGLWFGVVGAWGLRIVFWVWNCKG